MLTALDSAMRRHQTQLKINKLKAMKQEAENWMLEHPWRPFQRVAWRILEEGARDYIYWIKDPVGGRGKTTMKKIFFLFHPKDTVILSETTKKDILHIALKIEDRNYIIFDFAMGTEMTNIDYTTIENLHDNVFSSGKYDGDQTVDRMPRLICLANQEPQWSKVRLSRWRFTEVTGEDAPLKWSRVVKNDSEEIQFEDVEVTYSDI